MDEVVIPRLSESSYIFPDPLKSVDEGILAWGGDLNPDRLIAAYKKGIFPWFNEGDEILWWSPNPRAVLTPSEFKVSKSLKKSAKKYRVSFDRNFDAVIKACRVTRVAKNLQTWILKETIDAFSALHVRDMAHSIEVWDKDKLVGGLYGLVLGKVFCGESMFSLQRDASKVAFMELAKILEKYDFLIDCQVPNDHLLSLGVKTMEREKFLVTLHVKSEQPSGFESWSSLEKLVL